MTSKYPQSAIDETRRVTSLLCERCISSCVWWRRTRSWNTKWYDIMTHKGIKFEAKVWRIWNAAVIKQKQLYEDNLSDQQQYHSIWRYKTRIFSLLSIWYKV